MAVSCNNGHLECVRLLHEAGADIHWTYEGRNRDMAGATLLYLAVQQEHPHVVNYLISQGVEVNVIYVGDVHGYTPLHVAVRSGNTDTIALLLDAHAEVDDFDRTGDVTPLAIGCFHGKLDAVRLLAQHGANLAKRQ
eukprot:scaffold7995_cov173-Amphora_coffeaeformis.AAC.4